MSLENVTKEDLVQGVMDSKVGDIIGLIKLLVSQFGKEKAKELIKQTRWASRYELGRKAAERLGNPRDLDSYINEYFVNYMSSKVPWVLAEWIERTKNRAVCRCTGNCTGRILTKLGDDEIREIGKEAYCVHDIAWAAGFNPDIKLHITKSPYDGDDYCEFVMEI